METARPADISDVDDLARLWEHAVGELDGQRGGLLLAGGLVHGDVGSFVTRALGDPDRLLAVGLVDDVAVGVASAVTIRDRREPVGQLEVIFVEPPARRVGVAEAMMDVVIGWCRALDLVGLDAPALPGSRGAKSFFEVHGFQARLLTMHRPIAAERALRRDRRL